jgi:hypothetical protein
MSEALDPALLFSCLKTGGAQMLSADFTVTEQAKKPAARFTRNRCLLFRMKKATCFFVDEHRLRGGNSRQRAVECGEDLDL